MKVDWALKQTDLKKKILVNWIELYAAQEFKAGSLEVAWQ